MEIILLRHGKVDSLPLSTMSATSFGAWVDDYNVSKVDACSRPDNRTKAILRRARKVICSTLPRSLESAKILGADIYLVDEIFNESGLPTVKWKRPQLPVGIWAVFFRFAWLLGYSRNSESLKASRVRAKKASSCLVTLARQHDSVILVGHAVFNYLIAKELRKCGWIGPKFPTRKHWNFGVFTHK